MSFRLHLTNGKRNVMNSILHINITMFGQNPWIEVAWLAFHILTSEG
jgi:hypothetical protein